MEDDETQQMARVINDGYRATITIRVIVGEVVRMERRAGAGRD